MYVKNCAVDGTSLFASGVGGGQFLFKLSSFLLRPVFVNTEKKKDYIGDRRHPSKTAVQESRGNWKMEVVTAAK